MLSAALPTVTLLSDDGAVGSRIIGGRETTVSATIDPTELFWALKDVSFSLTARAVVGVIGRNGSGKSTLLKIIAQITAPTTGVRRSGRIGTLLEVGTGFYPALQRPEIFGMERSQWCAEIARKFDEIVDFGIEAFIERRPAWLKRNANAAGVFRCCRPSRAELWIVDEVLAVGDAEFQKKCLGEDEGWGPGKCSCLFRKSSTQNDNQLLRSMPSSAWVAGQRVWRIPQDRADLYFFGRRRRGSVPAVSEGATRPGDDIARFLRGQIDHQQIWRTLTVSTVRRRLESRRR